MDASQIPTFKLVLKTNYNPSLRQRVVALAPTDPETRFWEDLRRAPKMADHERYQYRESDEEQYLRRRWGPPESPLAKRAELAKRAPPPPPLPEKPSVPREITECRAILRQDLPVLLGMMIVRELNRYYEPPTPSDYEKASAAIRSIRFTVQDIRGGSLEVLLFVMGFAKLVQAIGITPEEFSKYMDIVAPSAMSLIFGVSSGALSANTTQVGDGESVGESGAETMPKQSMSSLTPTPIPTPSMTSLYFMPALFAAVAVGSLMYALVQLSSRLADDRAAYSGYLHEEMQSISQERHDIAEKLGTLISQHDTTLATAQKALFDDQMTLLKNASAAAAERDNAVVDLVRARLVPPPPEPAPLPEAKPILIDSKSPTFCALDETQIKNIQAALVEHSLYVGEPDGLWGPGTENGVRRFQSRMNLPITGRIDSATGSDLGINCKSP
jgi:peptidoglycan hydrolase-like protein with peptidoglycan-binding domain